VPRIGDRVQLESTKVGQVPRDGVVTGVDGALLRIEWSTGEESSLVPGAGSITVVGRVSGKTVAKRTSNKRAPARKAAKKTTKRAPARKPAKKVVKKRAPARQAAKTTNRAPARKAAKKVVKKRAPTTKRAAKR